jgi:transcriptional regulator with XRE-family HTH domain
MARTRKLTAEESRERRHLLADKAEAGELSLPDAVREARQAIGISQERFARLFGMTRRQIAEIERGEANPTLQTLQKIGKPFGFDVGFVPRTDRGPSGS